MVSYPHAIAQNHSRIICGNPPACHSLRTTDCGKIFKKNILPKVDNKLGKLLLHVPIISDKIKELIKQKAMEVFGGNFIEIIIGGAPFNAEVEAFLKMIDFPYTIAYGMTECGPIICHSHWTELKLASCGKVAARMEAKVLSSNPSAIAGELVCRGANLMLGYYKNEEATRQVIDTEGWLHTGDMATIDEDGNVFIKGRCKTCYSLLPDKTFIRKK